MQASSGTSAVPGVILAGGLASRMGGEDKAMAVLGGETLLTRVIARLAPQCGPLALNANGDPHRFDGYGLPVLADSVSGFAGPLAGILAGMDWAASLGADAVVTCAVDTPFFPADLVVRLQDAAGTQGMATAASRGPDGETRLHPTFGLWAVALRDDLHDALADGRRKVRQWAAGHAAGTAVFDYDTTVDPFFNINTPQDIETAQGMAGIV